jgi:ribosomal protein S18 acetylase RimI-like enzyme
MIHVRALLPEEHDFLMDMHYESIHIFHKKPSKHELLNSPALKKYNEEWGRTGDRALVAVSDNQLVGAAWYRLFDEANKGYGFVDNKTPELGIAIVPHFRHKGIGRLLIEALINTATVDGYSSLSLSVDPTNHNAVHLYEKLGFKCVRIVGTSWTMKLEVVESTIY